MDEAGAPGGGTHALMDTVSAYRAQLLTYLRKDCEAMARKSRKRVLPQWAVRKARAGAEEIIGYGRFVCPPDVAKKLYLERRRAVRILQKELRAQAGVIKTLSEIRPSKMSQARRLALENHKFARLVVAILADKVKGGK